MHNGGAHFAHEELEEILSRYDIGKVYDIKPLRIGNAKAPKMIIESEKGRFLLKRRAKGKDDVYHVAFAHAVQKYLESKGFPVASLLTTKDEKNTALSVDNSIYELFNFVEGTRYDGSIEAVSDTGRNLALFHMNLKDFPCNMEPVYRTFHNSPSVRRHLRIIGSMAGSRHRDKGMKQTADDLMIHYNHSSVKVNELGFESWPRQIVHGDWHPGNMLFSDNKVVCVLDFDSVKIASPVTDLANASLQFSIVAGRPNPTDWPSYFDQTKLSQFVLGYLQVNNLDEKMLLSLPDQMIETMIAEAVLPIATTGFFGHLSGLDFLKMILRKCNWIDQNRQLLREAIMN